MVSAAFFPSIPDTRPRNAHRAPLAWATVLSLAVHAALVGFVPAWRIDPPKPLPVLEVTLQPEPIPQAEPAPLPSPPARQPLPEPRAKPAPRREPLRQPARAPSPAPVQETMLAPSTSNTEAPRIAAPSAPEPPAEPAPFVARPAAPDPDALDRYRQLLMQGINARDKPYPRLARMRGWQGTTEVRVVIGPGGKVVSLARPSGYDILDRQALEMVEQAPLPPVPEALRTHTFTLRVPIEFRLEGGG